MNRLNLAIAAAFVIFAVVFLGQRFFRDDFRLPRGGEAKEEIITVPQSGAAERQVGVKKIMVTEGVRHSVPLEEIVGGGAPGDRIAKVIL